MSGNNNNNIININNVQDYDDFIITPDNQSPNKSSVSSSPALSSLGSNDTGILEEKEKYNLSSSGSGGISNVGNFKVPVQGTSSHFDRYLVQVFGCDLRSLAAARIGVSLLVILDCYVRSRFTYDHYTDLGVLPVQQIIDSSPYHWSLNFINTSTFYQNFLFTLNALFAFCWLIGYKTKIANIACWIFMTSVHVRNPLVLNGGDDFFRLMIFWLMLLPTGAKFSIDSLVNTEYHNRSQQRNYNNISGETVQSPSRFTTPILQPLTRYLIPTTDTQGSYYLSFATIGYLLQFSIVYYSTAYLKTGDEWNKDYSSVWIALHLDQFVTPLGIYLRDFIKLGMFLTWFTIKFEWYGSLLFFIPAKKSIHGPIRTLGCLGFAAMHIGFGSCLQLGFFMYIPIMSVIGFLPAWFWDNLLGYFTTSCKLNYTIYYKSTNSSVKKCLTVFKTFFLLYSTPIEPVDRDDDYGVTPLPQFTEANLRSSYYNEMNDNNTSFVVVNNLNTYRYFGYNAFIELLKLSPTLKYVAFLFKTNFFKRFYQYINSKSNVSTIINGTVERIYPSKPQVIKRSWILEIFCCFILIFVINWNLAGLWNYNIPDSVRWVGPTLRLEQYWSMFSPYPSKDNGWLVMPAILNNGTIVDLYTGGKPVTYDKPELVSASFPTQRWRKYLMNLQSASHKDRRLFYGRYLCREWNWYDRHTQEEQIQSFKIIFMFELISDMPTAEVPNPEKHPITPIELWSHIC